ncbi:hypothetical protein SDC9_166670 [bioreactor metagenome]|uniref:HotDog ACOT-type domain-containing protein n=1 Tax=bioreactor metagenome TaxID=1076179 RepID=A0A645G5V1_9ZZZZ
MKIYTSYKLIKMEELNHHGTLFAGRTAEIFVESGFTAASLEVKNPDQIVLVKIHSMTFNEPIQKGDVIRMESQIVRLGKTSLTAHITISSSVKNITPVEGFITFVNVDKSGKKIPHNLVLDETKNLKELELREIAKNLK